MPTATEHIEKAQRNEEVALLIQVSYPEWAVIALFYAAMHYVEAFFFVQKTARGLPQHYDTHVDRRKAIAQRAKRIYVDYETLFGDSLAARYKYEHFSSDDVDSLRDTEFKAVKAYIVNRLPPDLQPSP